MNKLNTSQNYVGVRCHAIQNGITLISLIITIIILLILAGVTLNMVIGENGLFTTAETSAEAYKIAEIEERARTYYVSEIANEVTGGTEATLAGVINKLRKEGYKIKEEESEIKPIKEIKLSEQEITLTTNQTQEITYEIIYEENVLTKYYIEIQGSYYEIKIEERTIKIDKNEVKIDQEEGKEETQEEVTITTSNENIVTYQKEGEKIILTAKNEIGTADITIEYKGKTGKCTINVGIPCTGISINPTTIEIEQGEEGNITVAKTPNDTTDTETYKVADEKIAKIENGTIIGLEAGTTIMTVTCGKITATCEVKVIVAPDGIKGTVKTHTAKALDYTWEELNAVAEIISDNYGSGENQVNNKTAEVTVKVNGKKYTVGVGDTTKLGGKTVRILGFNHDKLVDTAIYGEGKTNTYAGISFEFSNALYSGKMNSTDTSGEGWGKSLAHDTLNGDKYIDLINEANIKQVKKTYIKGAHGSNSVTGVSKDYLWLLAASEVWSVSSSGSKWGSSNGPKLSEGAMYKYYRDISSLGSDISNGHKKGSLWFLRSCEYIDERYFESVDSSGRSTYTKASSSIGISPGFAI